MPWFCLDNCDAIDNYQDGVTGCIFEQLEGELEFAHGTCVDFLCSCEVDNVNLPGVCEQAGMRCNVENQCLPECEFSSDCAAIGFPSWYECDTAGGYTPGHCVPPGCAGPGPIIDAEYCNLYR